MKVLQLLRIALLSSGLLFFVSSGFSQKLWHPTEVKLGIVVKGNAKIEGKKVIISLSEGNSTITRNDTVMAVRAKMFDLLYMNVQSVSRGTVVRNTCTLLFHDNYREADDVKLKGVKKISGGWNQLTVAEWKKAKFRNGSWTIKLKFLGEEYKKFFLSEI